jgi:hypothetical protein
MTKELKIERLRATKEMLESLPDDKFYYSNFVTEHDGKCGTVCCAAGWYPKYFPDTGIRWALGGKDDRTGIISTKTRFRSDVPGALAKWHGLNRGIIRTLFYSNEFIMLVPPEIIGMIIKSAENLDVMVRECDHPEGNLAIRVTDGIFASRRQVIDLFTLVIYLVTIEVI